MDTGNEKPQEQPVAAAVTPPAPDVASQQAAPSPQPSSSDPASAKRPASSMWLLIVVAAVVAGAGGYVLGLGGTQASDKNGNAPTPTVAKHEKKVNTKIKGSIKTDAHELDYLMVDVSEYGSVKAKNHESRYILEPQANIEYAYSFDELKPAVPYTVIMQGCAEKEQKTTCALSMKVVTCSGRIPGGAVQQCLITGDGTADFFLDKSLTAEFLSPTLTPTPTSAPPTATPTP
jgi:hypothetical protein